MINLLHHTKSVCILSIIIHTPSIVYALLSCRCCIPKQIDLTSVLLLYSCLIVSSCQSFCKQGGQAQQAFGRAWALPDVPLASPMFENNANHVSCVSAMLFTIVCILCLCTAYNSRMIVAKIATHYS